MQPWDIGEDIRCTWRCLVDQNYRPGILLVLLPILLAIAEELKMGIIARSEIAILLNSRFVKISEVAHLNLR